MIELPSLPYPQGALTPHISERTIGYHYGKHHAGYVANLNKLLAGGGSVGGSAGGSAGGGGSAEGSAEGSAGGGGSAEGGGTELGLEALIANAGPGVVFNNAAQIWNHTFYWQSMSPDGGGEPSGELAAAIISSFGSVDALRAELTAKATGNFGSGWTWLVRRGSGDGPASGDGAGAAGGDGGDGGDGELAVVNTDDADNPLVSGHTPLLTIDIWEHAYYLDYQNARPAYVATFLEHLINWDYAAANYAAA